MVKLTLHRFSAPWRAPSFASASSSKSAAYEQRQSTPSHFLRIRLPRILHATAIVFCCYAFVAVFILNLSPPYARLFGMGKIVSWRLNSTPTTSPSHYRRSEYFYTLYPSGVCVQVISEPPSALALPANEDAMRNLVRRTIDHDSNRFLSSSPCIVPFGSKSALSFKIPYPYSIDDYAPNEAVFVQRPYSLIGSIDLYPAFVLYMLSIMFGSLPMYTLLKQWQRNSRFYRRLRSKEKDDEYHHHVYYRPEGASAGAGAGILGANVSSSKPPSYTQLDGPQLYTHATICGLLSMTGMILACVNITLLRNSLTWNLERGAPDVDNVWKEDVGMAIAWSATACVILPAMIMLLRLLVVLAYRQGWVPRHFAELL